jgi:hypothetical protein
MEPLRFRHMGATWVDGHLDLQVRGVLKWGLRRPHGDTDGLQENRDVPVPNRPCADAPGHPERQIARGHSMGWGKLAALRKLAEERGWLDAQTALPEEAQIAAALGTPKQAASTISTLEPHRERIAGWLDQDCFGRERRLGFAAPAPDLQANTASAPRATVVAGSLCMQSVMSASNIAHFHDSRNIGRGSPETATRLSKAGPEVYEAAALKSPWYSQRFTSRFRNTGMAESCCASSSPVGSIMAPRPHRITRGACGFSTRVRQAATTAPFFVGK